MSLEELEIVERRAIASLYERGRIASAAKQGEARGVIKGETIRSP